MSYLALNGSTYNNYDVTLLDEWSALYTAECKYCTRNQSSWTRVAVRDLL